MPVPIAEPQITSGGHATPPLIPQECGDVAHLCIFVAIMFYPKFVPEPWPLGERWEQWAILPIQRISTFNYALHNTSRHDGEIERVWPIPYDYCEKEGFRDE